ncbi:MAG: YciI family protein [Alphaproteobacteria bacterium]|nr:YciI family protein [Alphaproteobacteria bacterium]
MTGLYVIDCTDKPDAFALRQQTRPDHLSFLAGLGEALVLAGPFQDDQGRSIGSLVIVRAETRQAAEAIARRDPYARAGLFASSSVRSWVWALNKPEGL